MTRPPFDLARLGSPDALDLIVAEVRAAGRLALDHYAQGAANRTVKKPDRSPVTEADRAVEEHLRQTFAAGFPKVGFKGEETGEALSSSGLRFIVDPIDGTRAFIRGIPTWSVLVGLEADGEPVLGVAHFPADGDMLVGVRGHGATLNGQPLRVSDVASLDDAVVSHGALLQFTGAHMEPLLGAIARRTYTQRGFTDFDGYRKLVLGQVDAMVEPGIQAWDVCPAAVIVEEAGGRFTDFQGTPSIHSGTSVASNGKIHDALLDVIREALR